MDNRIQEYIARLAHLKQQVNDYYDVLTQSTLAIDDYEPATHGPILTYSSPQDLEEIERYWVDAPFAFVTINHDQDANEHRYQVVEPDLQDWEITLLENLIDDLRYTLIHRRDLDEVNTEATLSAELKDLLKTYGVRVSVPTFYKLFYYLTRRFNGYSRIQPIMMDPSVEDISCDGYDIPVFVYHSTYADVKTNISFDETELDEFIVSTAQHSGQSISIANPITDVKMPDGSRGELSLSDKVTPKGSAFTIRKYEDDPMTPATLIDYGTFSRRQMAYLWLAIENNKSLIFAGGTASGKTTSMNAISMFLPPRSKVITIEDTQEIRLNHENWLSAVTRESISDTVDIDMYDLLRSALRHRPEYIIVGEVRGREAMTLFQAMNTGHTTYSTMHADDIRMVINRLENDPINVPRAMIQSLDIVSIQRISHVGDNRVRRAGNISEVLSVDQRSGDLDYVNTFDWHSADDTFEDRTEQSRVLEEIQTEHGWTSTELANELRNREQILEFAQQNDITDYREFTRLVREYYTNPTAVLDRINQSTTNTTKPR